MLSISKVIYKEKQYVEGYKKLIGKKVQEIEEHYNIIVDEVSEGRINQQSLWAKADNEELIEKLENLTMYQQVKFLVNVSFYEGRPSKVTVLDFLNETETQTIEAIFKRVEQKQQEERQKKEQE